MCYGGIQVLPPPISELTISKKKDLWEGSTRFPFNYNLFYGEANSFYAQMYPIEYQNGALYPTIDKAFEKEGAYPFLMVSADDVVDFKSGSYLIPWKKDGHLTAFNLCKSYQGDGYHDWRLPRLSELALLYLNRESLGDTRGFSPLSGTYWSGSEYQKGTSDEDRKKSDQAWAINFDAPNPGNAANHTKTETLRIRCVRQIK